MSYTPGPLPDDVFRIDEAYPGMALADQILAYAAAEVARAVAAERERCAKVCEPKGTRPCDCTSCDCGNSTNARMVAEWDEAMSLAAAIRADPQRLQGEGE